MNHLLTRLIALALVLIATHFTSAQASETPFTITAHTITSWHFDLVKPKCFADPSQGWKKTRKGYSCDDLCRLSYSYELSATINLDDARTIVLTQSVSDTDKIYTGYTDNPTVVGDTALAACSAALRDNQYATSALAFDSKLEHLNDGCGGEIIGLQNADGTVFTWRNTSDQ